MPACSHSLTQRASERSHAFAVACLHFFSLDLAPTWMGAAARDAQLSSAVRWCAKELHAPKERW